MFDFKINMEIKIMEQNVSLVNNEEILRLLNPIALTTTLSPRSHNAHAVYSSMQQILPPFFWYIILPPLWLKLLMSVEYFSKIQHVLQAGKLWCSFRSISPSDKIRAKIQPLLDGNLKFPIEYEMDRE